MTDKQKKDITSTMRMAGWGFDAPVMDFLLQTVVKVQEKGDSYTLEDAQQLCDDFDKAQREAMRPRDER